MPSPALKVNVNTTAGYGTRSVPTTMPHTDFAPLTAESSDAVTWSDRVPWERIGQRMLTALRSVAELFADDEHGEED